MIDTDLQAALKNIYRDMLAPPPETLPVSETDNPYWDILRTIPGNAIEWRYEHVWQPDASALFLEGMYTTRRDLCRKYTYAVPDPASLRFVAKWLAPAAIEMGSGVGYWSWQLSQLGVEMLVYDIHPPQQTGENFYHSPRDDEREELTGATRPVYFEVQQGTPDVLVQHPDRTLFLSWPPMSDMAAQCLQHYQGKRLVYIGESSGGCTADEAFFERLEQEWEEVASHEIVQWWGIHDWITVYERRETNEHITRHAAD